MKIIAQLAFISMVFLINSVASADKHWIDSNKAIPDLHKVLMKARKEMIFMSQGKAVRHFIAFPAQVPQPDKTLFANLVIQNHETCASIIIGNRENCRGEKDCRIVDLHFDVGKNPEIIYDLNNNKITLSVDLHHEIKGYLTPEYAMGSTFPANLTWRDGAILYTLNVWNWPSLSQSDLIHMANSIINTLRK